ncbi:uncharacterized protein kiaa1958 isoform X1 [Brachyhypopomus gauderio]|uniref:uncharacterized protein kiaa1958 isoform X1 n=1 Tax=Brachyhypopomus gauderio TaxID=698409 RepID=UPI004041EB6E
MEECLHTSADGLAKLVKWAHSHGTICTLIPSLKHLLTEGANGSLTALWGCGAGHAYHWPLTSSCKTAHKERACCQGSRVISSDALIQGAAAMQASTTERFLNSTAKAKGDPTRDSCDFSNCSEPSEMDDNTEEYNNHLFDIVCESSATDEEGDSEPRVMHRKRGTKGPELEDCSDPEAKKIKQERAEDYYTVANPQIPGDLELAQPCNIASQSPKPNSQTHPSSRLSAVHKPCSVDGDSVGVSSSPVDNPSPSVSKPPRAPVGSSQSKAHMNLNLTANQIRPGRSDLVEGLPNGDFGLSFGDVAVVANPEMDILAAQALSAESKGDGTGCLASGSLNSEEQFWPSTSELCPVERNFDERKQLEEFITSVDPVTLRNLQAVISRILVFHERTRASESSPPRFGGPSSPRFGGPSSPRFGGPSSPRFGGPSSPRFGGPNSPRFGGPNSPRFGGPNSPRFGGPSSPRFGGPSSPRFGGPSPHRFGGPGSPRFGGPGSPRFGGPGSPRIGGPGSPRFGAPSPPRFGEPEQELFPGSGLFLPPYKLACMHRESRQDSMRLFHLLFEHFFSEEDLIGAVAFGKRGKVPAGKKILDRRTVDGVMSYVLRCSSLDGWTPVEPAKLKKACINKCRLRTGQRRKLSQEAYLYHSPQKSGPSYI